MDKLHGTGVQQLQVDAGDAGIAHLAEELAEVGATLVPHPRFGEQATTGASLAQTVAEVDVLAKAHLAETAQLLPEVTAYAHVEGTGIELVELLLATTNASRSEERRHRIADGLLHRREVGVGAIGTAKGIAGCLAQRILDGREVGGRQHDIRVQHNEVVASSTLGTIVARCTRTAILLHVVVDVQTVGEVVAHLAAGDIGAVLHHVDIEVAESLPRKALQQLRHLLGAVIDRDDDAVFHRCYARYFRLQRYTLEANLPNFI